MALQVKLIKKDSPALWPNLRYLALLYHYIFKVKIRCESLFSLCGIRGIDAPYMTDTSCYLLCSSLVAQCNKGPLLQHN